MDTINWQAERSWPFRNRNRVVTLVLRLVAMEDAITPPPREFPHSTPLSTCLHNATPARSCARVRACKRGIKTPVSSKLDNVQRLRGHTFSLLRVLLSARVRSAISQPLALHGSSMVVLRLPRGTVARVQPTAELVSWFSQGFYDARRYE